MDAEPEDDLAPERFAVLLAEARQGSQAAFGLLIQWKRRQLERFIAHRLDPAVRTKVAVSDIWQDAAIDAWSDFETFRGASEAEFYRFLQAIVANTLCDRHRHFAGSQKRDVHREIRLGDGTGSTADTAWLVGGARPDRSAERREEQTRLEVEIERLPDDYRTAFRLRFFEDLSFKGIGERMGRSEDAARKLVGRAFDLLAQRIVGRRDDDGGPKPPR